MKQEAQDNSQNQSHAKGHRFLLSMFSGAGSVILRTILSIIIVPLLIRLLGKELYGLYIVLISLVAMSSLMELGFTRSIIKLLGIYRSQNKHDKVENLLRMSHFLFLSLSSLALLLSLAFLPWIVKTLHVESYEPIFVKICVAIVLIEGAFSVYSAYYTGVLASHCLNYWTNLSDTLSIMIGNALGALLLLAGFDLRFVLLARLVGVLTRFLILFMQTVKAEPSLFKAPFSFSFKGFRELFSQSANAFMVDLSVIISHKIDYFVIAYFLTLSQVGVFEIVFRLLGVAQQIVLKISEVALPAFAQLSTLTEKTQSKKLFLRMSCLNNFIISLLLMLVVAFYPILLRWISGNVIPLKPTLPILLIAVPTMWSGVIQMPASSYLFSSGRQKFLTISSLITAFCNLSLSILLVKSLGLPGVALGTLIPQFIQHQFSLIREACLELEITLWEYVRSVHLSVLLPLGSAFLIIEVLKRLLNIEAYAIPSIIFIGILSSVVSSILWFTLTASDQEKDFFITKIFNPIKHNILSRTSFKA